MNFKKHLAIVIFPFLLFCFVEGLFAGGIVPFFQWVLHSPLYAMLSFTLFLSLINIFYFLNSIVYKILAGMVGLIITVLAIISRIKYEFRGDLLYISDISLINEVSDISEYLNNTIYTKLIVSSLILIILWIVLKYIPFPTKKITRGNISLRSISLLSLIFVFVGPAMLTLKQDTYEMLPKQQSVGFLFGLVSQLYNDNEGYNDYNSTRIAEINNALPTYKNTDDFTPNVIMVLSEAFWDPTNLPGVQFQSDPLPFFNSLSREYSSGHVLSPVYGGATANAEFESLTGLSTQFIKKDTPYTNVINRPLDSLASIYKRQGYNTAVVHSYHNWFYNRPTVYKYLGFDTFISGEFFNSPTMIGPFMDDKNLYESVINEMRSTEKPDFIYTITMLNHGPYSSDRFKSTPYDINSISGEMTEATRDILNTYTNSLKITDEAFEQLITNLSSFEEPTIVVFFGDHLPLLGEDYLVYKELNYFESEETASEYKRKYSTPIVIWNNFGAPKEDLGLISTNFIGDYVLKLSKKQGNSIFSSLGSLREEGITAIPKKRYYEDFGITETQIHDFKLMQHDVLIGNDYSKTNKAAPSALKMGSSELFISNTNPTNLTVGMDFNRDANGESVLIINGSGFIPKSWYFDFIKGSQIYINDEPFETNFINENSLSVNIPLSMYSNLGELKVEVKITDTKNNILTQSNSKILSIQSEENTIPIIRWAEPGEIKVNSPFNEVDGISYLRLAADNLTNNSQIYINGSPMKSIIKFNGYIESAVPESLLNQANTLSIEIRTPSQRSNQLILYVTE